MERHFEKDLNELKERLLWMGSLAERAVHQSRCRRGRVLKGCRNWERASTTPRRTCWGKEVGRAAPGQFTHRTAARPPKPSSLPSRAEFRLPA